MISNRISCLKETLLSSRPCISSERIKLATEAYQKYSGVPIILLRAKVFAYILENMSIKIDEDELIVGTHSNRPRCAPVYPEYISSNWLEKEIDSLPVRSADKLEVPPQDKKEILGLMDWWKEKSMQEITEESLPDNIKDAVECGLITIGSCDGATGHTNPHHAKLLELGLDGYINLCEEKIHKTIGGSKELQEKIDFWNACIIVCNGIIKYSERYSVLAENLAKKESDDKRKAELTKIMDVCRNVPRNKPRNFHEVVQFVWFIQLMIHIESNAHANGMGRFDSYAYPYYKMDKDSGGITEEEAVELLQCLYIKVSDIIKLRGEYYSKAFAGFSMWQTIMLGGQTADGRDASNELSYLMLEAADGVKLAQPALCLVCFEGTPDKLFRKGVEMVRSGQANPAFFNDKVAVPICLAKGGSIEESREWVTVGCIEPYPGRGTSDGLPTAGYLNILKCLELVLHNGKDPVTGKQVGLKTGDPAKICSLDQLIDATKEQAKYFLDMLMLGYNIVLGYHINYTPNVFASIVIDDCIDKGVSVQAGGARHSYSGISIAGAANVADSFVSIDQLVFKEKKITMRELISILDKNFEGSEDLRQMLLNVPPKFGNDIDVVDYLAEDIVNFTSKYVQSPEHKDARGGQYAMSNLSQTLNLTQGDSTAASADGRKAFTPLADNASPHMGRDVSGPTAVVNSVSKLDQIYCWNGSLFNLRFDPASVRGEKGLDIIESVIKNYFDRYGFHIQINVVDNETLLAAQSDPENYRGIVVRVAGYLAFFTELDKKAQDIILARTAHGQY